MLPEASHIPKRASEVSASYIHHRGNMCIGIFGKFSRVISAYLFLRFVMVVAVISQTTENGRSATLPFLFLLFFALRFGMTATISVQCDGEKSNDNASCAPALDLLSVEFGAQILLRNVNNRNQIHTRRPIGYSVTVASQLPTHCFFYGDIVSSYLMGKWH